MHNAVDRHPRVLLTCDTISLLSDSEAKLARATVVVVEMVNLHPRCCGITCARVPLRKSSSQAQGDLAGRLMGGSKWNSHVL